MIGYNTLFSVQDAYKLYKPLKSLCNKALNFKGLGRVDITEKGFYITVRNSNTRVTAHLHLSPELNDFDCCKTIIGKLVVAEFLIPTVRAIRSKKPLSIYHVEGSEKLSFRIGTDKDTDLHINFKKEMTDYVRVPTNRPFCEAFLPSEKLRDIIQMLQVPGISQILQK